MLKRVMLILIGGRSAVPSVAGLLQFITEIDQTKFLVCDGERYQELLLAIQQFIQQKNRKVSWLSSDIKFVDPNNFAEVYNAISSLCGTQEEIRYVNLVSAPQTMAIATYSYFRDHHSQALVFTVNTDQAKLIPLAKDKTSIPFKEKLSVKDYITACNGSIFESKSANKFNDEYIEKYRNLVAYFADTISCTNSIFSEIKQQAAKGGESIKSPKMINLTNSFITNNNLSKSSISDFLQKLEEEYIISKLDIDQDITFSIKPDGYTFINGDWLEILVYLRSKECGFDDVEIDVEMSNYNGEIDIFCLHNSNALICECKSGGFSKKDIFKFRALGEKLGGNYCTKVFVASNTEVSDEYENEANNSKIVLLTGRNLFNLVELLKKEMQEPRYSRY